MERIIQGSQESGVRSQKPEGGRQKAEGRRQKVRGYGRFRPARTRCRLPTAHCPLLCRLLIYCLLPAAFCFLLCSPVRAQQVADKMVATINAEENGLVTYSDLLWQLALEPDVPLDRPRREDLQRALQTVIDQRLIALEAEKLPAIAPTDKEINTALTELIQAFPSRADFEQRLRRVGLTAEQLREVVLRRRVATEKYVNFRFRSFTFPIRQEVEAYYADVYVPRERRRAPGRIVPRLEDVFADVEKELTESRVASDIGAFIESARASAAIVYLNSL